MGSKIVIAVMVLFTGSSWAAMPKAEFSEKFRKGAPATFCGEGTYFQKCFTLDKGVCEKVVNENVGGCITSSEKEVPANLTTKEDGGSFGKKIGTCLGEKLETTWKDKKKTLAECSNISAWTK